MNNGDSRFPKALLFSFHCGTRYRLSRRHLRELLFGTGSMPPRPNGLQRSTLHTARASPRIAPHSFTASIAYCEQVGVNRQQGFLSGDMNFRYRVISHISTYFMTVYSRGRLGLRYEGFLTGLCPDPPKTFLKEGFWISKNFCQGIYYWVLFLLRQSLQTVAVLIRSRNPQNNFSVQKFLKILKKLFFKKFLKQVRAEPGVLSPTKNPPLR